jgi:hypothetical protein
MITLHYKKVNNQYLKFDYNSKRQYLNMVKIIDQIDCLFLERDKEKVNGYICILDGYDILVSVSSINLQRFLSVHAKKKGSNVVFNRIDFYEVDDINKWVSYLDNENIFKSDMLSPTPNKAISFHNQSDLDKINIEVLDLSVSAYNALKANKINTLYELTNKSQKQILTLNSIGVKALENIKQALSAYSLTLKQ